MKEDISLKETRIFATKKSMAKIILEGMLFKSFIGVFDFEQERGNKFEVQLTVEDDSIVSENDTLEGTLDYTLLFGICQEVMSGRYRLIETAAQKIIAETKKLISDSGTVTVRICKLNPPLGGDIKKVCIEIKD